MHKDTGIWAASPLFSASRKLSARKLHLLAPEPDDSPAGAARAQAPNCAVAPPVEPGAAQSGRLTILDIPFALADDALLAGFDAGSTVLCLTPMDGASPQTMARAADLQARGFRLMLSGCRRDSKIGPFVSLCDFLSLDFSGDHRVNLDIIKVLKRYNFTVAAFNLATWEEFERASASGIELFGGPFFRTVELGANKVKGLPQVKLNLMRQLSKKIDEIDVNEVSQTVSLDAHLSVQLLRLVNSAAFNLPYAVDSISQAVRLVGMESLKRWISVALLSEIDSSDKGQELMFRALHRAVFLSMLSQSDALPGMDSERLFLLGMLSFADAIFGVEMAELVDELQLPAEIADALCARKDSQWAWLIAMMDAIELNITELARELMAAAKLNPMLTARIYMSSCRIAESMIKGLA